MEQKFDNLMDAITEEVHNQISEFQPQNIANISWAYATLRIENEEFYATIAQTASVRLTECDVRAMASIAWSFARIVKQDAPLIDAISELSIDRTLKCRIEARVAPLQVRQK